MKKNKFLIIPNFNLNGTTISNVINDLLYSSLYFSINNSASSFYAIPISWIENIEILFANDLFSIKVTPLSKDSSNNLISWTMLSMTPIDSPQFLLAYKSSLLFNNETIFPGCSDYIKNTILNIV